MPNRNLMLCCILPDASEVKLMRGSDFFRKPELLESCVGMNICIDTAKSFLNGSPMYLYEWKVQPWQLFRHAPCLPC